MQSVLLSLIVLAVALATYYFQQSSQVDIKVGIHVFAWQRIRSLQRLLDSLNAANYSQKVSLYFHIDGNSKPGVTDLIRAFQWPHGDKFIDMRNARMGLAGMITTAWQVSETSDEYAIFLEDDIEVSPLFFEYSLMCTTQVLPLMSNRTIGCALHTPRLNEVSAADYDYGTNVFDDFDPQNPASCTPSQVLGRDRHLFAFQLPCSWGALYSAKSWAQFLEFYHKRTRQVDPIIWTPIIGLHSHHWKQSWKRFMIDFFFIHGLTMVYTSFAFESSFSTNHYEEGVHTVSQDVIINATDNIEVLKHEKNWADSRFTVPLIRIQDREHVWQQLHEEVSALRAGVNFPLIDVFHRVSSQEIIEDRAAKYRKMTGFLD